MELTFPNLLPVPSDCNVSFSSDYCECEEKYMAASLIVMERNGLFPF